MRILIDARSLVDPLQGGVTRVARGVIESFLKTTTDEVVLATTGSSKPDLKEFESPSVRHIHITIPNKVWSAFTTLGIASLDREIEKRVGSIDIVFLPNVGFIGNLHRPYVLLIHDLSFIIEPRWFSLKGRWWHKAVRATALIKHATQLLAVSETTKRDAVKLLRIPQERIDVIPMGPTLPQSVISTEANAKWRDLLVSIGLQTDPTTSSDSARDDIMRYVLALGWNDVRKNARTADRAVAILNQDPQFVDVKCIIVGRDVIRPSDAELASLYKNASAFLYPSWYEGYGLPLWEAASYGTACIASTTGSLPETAPPGTRFVDPAKPHHWAEALKSVIPTHTKTPLLRVTESWLPAAKTLSEAISRCH